MNQCSVPLPTSDDKAMLALHKHEPLQPDRHQLASSAPFEVILSALTPSWGVRSLGHSLLSGASHLISKSGIRSFRPTRHEGPCQQIHLKSTKKTPGRLELGKLPYIQSFECLQSQQYRLFGDTSAVIVLRFSPSGEYLAGGTTSGLVYVWRMREDLGAYPNTEACRLTTEPVHVYKSHKSEIIDLSWSQNDFLLTTSLGGNVHLWHVHRDECLRTFNHAQPVSCAKFHPVDDRFFASGSLDNGVRLWNVLSGKVIHLTKFGAKVTALCFTPNGETIICGTAQGSVFELSTKTFEVKRSVILSPVSTHPYIHRNKITSLSFAPSVQGDKLKVLVSATGNILHIYDYLTFALLAKLVGASNKFVRVEPSYSTSNQVVCGSQDHRVYIWDIPNNLGKDALEPALIDQYDYFNFGNHSVTCATFAPRSQYRTTQNMLVHGAFYGQTIVVANSHGDVNTLRQYLKPAAAKLTTP